MSITLPVNEIFESIQGEGHYTGTPSIFIRFQGCDVGCHWCDTKHTWDIDPNNKIATALIFMKQEDSKHYAEMTISDLMTCINEFNAKHIVLTGGEPCMHNIEELTTSIIESGRTCQVETSGTYPIKVHHMTWVTLSPKLNMAGKKEIIKGNILRADEIKYPVGKLEDVENLKEHIYYETNQDAEIWLQPLSQSEKATALCIEQAILNNFKISIQVHKYLGVR